MGGRWRRRPSGQHHRVGHRNRDREDAWAVFPLSLGNSNGGSMTYVWTGVVVVDVDPDAGVRVEVDNVPFRVIRIRIVFLLCEKQDRVIVVGLE